MTFRNDQQIEQEYRAELVRIKVSQGYREYAAKSQVAKRELSDVIAVVERYRILAETTETTKDKASKAA